jgi:hypothetical protein
MTHPAAERLRHVYRSTHTSLLMPRQTGQRLPASSTPLPPHAEHRLVRSDERGVTTVGVSSLSSVTTTS